MMFPNHPDFISGFFAASRLGAVVVPVNPLLKADEISHIIEDSGAIAILAHDRLAPEIYAALANVDSDLSLFLLSYGERQSAEPDAGALSAKLKVNVIDASELSSSAPGSAPETTPGKDDLAVLVYTSGTTGKPKGAMLTHGNLIAAAEMRRKRIPCSPQDRLLTVLPLCHIYGLSIVMLGTLADGGALVLAERFEAGAALDLIERHGVTILPAVPAMFQFMMMELKENPRDVSSLRLGLCGGAPIEPAMLRRFDKAFGATVVEGYALTETSCIATITPPDGPRKSGSVGPAVPGVELKVVDSEGVELPPGKSNIGEIAIRGANVLRGYYNRPEETEETLKDGWFHTGDLGYVDRDGYLYIRGRMKEMIIRGGQNIYPREIETVVAKLADVIECAVVGVPDKFMGERVKVVAVLKAGSTLTEEAVKKHCTELLAPFKVPRLVSFVDSLPRNSTGKVLKRLLIDGTESTQTES